MEGRNVGELFPQLITEWISEENIHTVPQFSSKEITWKCENGHEWTSKVSERTRKRAGCPHCTKEHFYERSKRRKPVRETSLGALFPELVGEWDDERDIFSFGPYSNEVVKWVCKYDHRWTSPIKSRTHGNEKCPTCEGMDKIQKSLGIKYQHLIPEWADKDCIFSVFPFDNKEAKWKCSRGHIWEASIKERVRGNPTCYICDKLSPEKVNSLLKLKSEWDDSRDINEFRPFSREIVKWRCKYGHRWECAISSRTNNGNGCPECFVNEKSLGARFPHLTKEWADDRDIFSMRAYSTTIAKWRCKCGHEWEQRIIDRTKKKMGCPMC